MKKILCFIALLFIAFLFGCSKDNSTQTSQQTPQQTKTVASNKEAQDFATAMNNNSKAFGVKAEWYIELEPAEIKGDIEEYRNSVKYVKATITVDPYKWEKMTNTAQDNFIRAMMNTIHKPAAFQSKTLDYYPNSSGELSIVAKGKVIAKGTYTPTTSDVKLGDETTYAKDTVNVKGKYSVKLTVDNKDNGIELKGLTDLPEGEEVLISLKGEGFSGQSKVAVRDGKFTTETFSNRGSALLSGEYSVYLNVYNSKTTLMLEGRDKLNIPQTTKLSIVMNPTKF